MRIRLTRQQEHLALFNSYIRKRLPIDYLQQHPPLVLIEPLLCVAPSA
jgi:hypothetical protein